MNQLFPSETPNSDVPPMTLFGAVVETLGVLFDRDRLHEELEAIHQFQEADERQTNFQF